MRWEDIKELQEKYGFVPLPCPEKSPEHDGKHPFVNWTDYRATPPSPRELKAWFEDQEAPGVWSIMGPTTGWAVLDTDNQAGELLWRQRLGDLLDRTACVRTRRGFHYYFKVAADAAFPRWTWEDDEEAKGLDAHFDVLGHGYGVMLPPSLFPDGPADDGRDAYEWVRGPEHALPVPGVMLKPKKGPKHNRQSAVSGRSTLAGLLAERPDAGLGLRNSWHNKVAGHFAKLVPYEDGFLAMATIVNDSLPVPMDEAEVMKTWKQAWSTEKDKGEMGSANTGWLSSDGKRMYTAVRLNEGDAKTTRPVPWLNGDIKVTGVAVSEDNSRSYQVIVQRLDGLPLSDLLKATMLGSPNEFKKWLARHGMSIEGPPLGAQDLANNMDPGARLIRYFESRRLEPSRTVPFLGWHDGIGFVTHEGVITAEGLETNTRVIPNPDLLEAAPYRYGMGDIEATKDVLREVLDFQEPWVAAVFGSWWVMTLLKGQVMTQTGHFPYMIIEAASEAGKTRGMFALLRCLSGSVDHGTGTAASIRDKIGSHRSGLVHIDDANQIDEKMKEHLREAPGEGTYSKKAEDNKGTVNIRLVAPILISGEAIGLRGEKAHRDRSVEIKDVPSPKGRMSLKNPSRPQVDDVMAMMARDLSDYSGTMVMLALQQAHWCDQIKELRGAAGRHNEVMAVVRCGARVLDSILEREWAVPLVEAWAGGQKDLGAENTLVTSVLPWILNEYHGDLWGKLHPAYYAFVDDKSGMWMHVPTLSALWQKELRSRGKVDRLDSAEAFVAQLRAMKAEFGQKSIGGKKPKAWKIPEEYRVAAYNHAAQDGTPPPPEVQDRLERYQRTHSRAN